VGSEDRGHPLKKFLPELLWFQSECTQKNLTIPFLFHAGETLDTGTTTDQNLIDAVLLNSKRIGHGFALSRHPEVLEMIKSRGICLETCPISNEILHLTSTIKGHVLPDLLARNVHCTVNSDNGTFYRFALLNIQEYN
jgi:adenosine deaminase CECR1